jgi:hypothetical protein
VKRDIGKAVESMEPVHEVYVSKSVGSERDAEEGDNFVRRILDDRIGRSPLCSHLFQLVLLLVVATLWRRQEGSIVGHQPVEDGTRLKQHHTVL